MIKNSDRYQTLTENFIQKWNTCPNSFPKGKRKFSFIEKRIWEFKLNSFMDEIKKQSNSDSLDKGVVLERSRQFFRESLNYTDGQLELIFSDQMLNATKDFMKKAWMFDSELSNEEMFQALRNIWIMLGLQQLFNKRVEITPSLLAYSLLYPYTDNLIDDAMVSMQEKMAFSDRFEARLKGETVMAKSPIEDKIYHLVYLIESEFERNQYPDLYQSLLDIHEEQTKSISLLNNHDLCDKERMEICIRKGATSVIADGYLVAGKLSTEQVHFLFEYGAYLQILDDLQDARDDLHEGVLTCFSKKLHSQYLDKLLCKTYYLGKEVLATVKQIYPGKIAFQGLIKRSFGLLFASSVIANPKDFSPSFINLCERHSPFRFSFAEKYKKELKGFYSLFEKRLEEYKKKDILELR